MSQGLILLPPGNRILGETVGPAIRGDEGGRDPMDIRLCDFDDVMYHIAITQEDPKNMKISMALPCFGAIQEKGGQAAFDAAFGDMSCEPGAAYNLAINVDLDNIKDPEELIKKIVLFKPIVVGGIFDYYFQAALDEKPIKEGHKFDLRGDTSVFLVPKGDNVIVIYQFDCADRVDQAVAKVFMQEFVDGKKKIGAAPPCSWTTNAPAELASFGITGNDGALGFLSFNIMTSHTHKGKKENVIRYISSFRNYLQYHIKCAKSFFSMRMRAKAAELVKVMNRAKMEPFGGVIKKTAQGKTFK
jgi:actin related protein 2/3 complex subunit 2